MNYGKRGGQSPTAGKAKAIYEAKAPDGSILHVGSFKVSSARAHMFVTCAGGGCWYGDAVRETPEPFPLPTGVRGEWVACKRVK